MNGFRLIWEGLRSLLQWVGLMTWSRVAPKSFDRYAHREFAKYRAEMDALHGRLG